MVSLQGINADEHIIIHACTITRKASMGMYPVCDDPYYSCLNTFWHLHLVHPSILCNYFLHLYYYSTGSTLVLG